jgi:hypothetical protein
MARRIIGIPVEKEAGMQKPTHRLIGASTTLVLAALVSGCQSARSTSTMTSSTTSTHSIRLAPVEWPLRFKSHSFGARCYGTLECKVVYADLEHGEDKPTLPSASYGPDYLKGWSGGHIGIRNFPEPAKVTWRSKDGTAHEAEIDIGEIFKDQLIRHNVPREEMADLPDGKYEDTPSILLEVNDRMIRVYMSAFISTKNLQRPESKYSDYRDDVILVKTFTY